MLRNLLSNLPFEYASCPKWTKNKQKPTIIRLSQFAISKGISELGNTPRILTKSYHTKQQGKQGLVAIFNGRPPNLKRDTSC